MEMIKKRMEINKIEMGKKKKKAMEWINETKKLVPSKHEQKSTSH